MKIDMHCHSYYSRDGMASPEALFRQAKKIGLDGLALTDHNNIKGWERAKNEAQKLGLVFIPGEEIKIKQNGQTIGEILAYFIKQEIKPGNKSVEEVINEIRAQGGLAIIAHPYHWKKPFKELEKSHLADGMENFNSRSQSVIGNKKSMELAQKNNFSIIAGSDAHTIWEIGNAYIESDANNLEELKNNILNQKIKIRGKQTPFLIQIFAPISKLVHLFWRP